MNWKDMGNSNILMVLYMKEDGDLLMGRRQNMAKVF
jgi:hypothetical protein